MELILWKHPGQHGMIQMPMMKSKHWGRICTTGALRDALQLSEHALWNIVQRYKARVQPLSLSNLQAKDSEISDFIRLNKEELGLTRLRQDMYLWPLRQCLRVAFVAKTDAAYDLHEGLIDQMERDAEELAVSAEQYKELRTMIEQVRGMSRPVPRLALVQ